MWLLKQWASPYQRESLAGDLLEMYRGGRSRLWLWRQVIAALWIARLRAFRMLPRTGLGSALEGFTKASVNAYRVSLEARGLSASTINQRLSAIRKLAVEAADNGFMPLPDRQKG